MHSYKKISQIIFIILICIGALYIFPGPMPSAHLSTSLLTMGALIETTKREVLLEVEDHRKCAAKAVAEQQLTGVP